MVNPVERHVKSLSLRRADYRLSLFVQGFRLSHFHVSPRQHEEEKRFLQYIFQFPHHFKYHIYNTYNNGWQSPSITASGFRFN